MDSVRINKQIRTDYLDALIAVHNATALPANDTITRFLSIHTYNPGLNSLVIMADSNFLWMSNLKNDILPTGDKTIDRMIKKYAFKKVFYSSLLQPNMVVFKTELNCNLYPIANDLKNYHGVKSAESDFLYGDGNDITDSINDKYIELTYSFGWDDCPSGCQQRRYWKFRVYSDCSVEYIGSYGRPLQPALSLSLIENENLFNDILIYTNPVKNKLYIERKDLKSKNAVKTIAVNIINKRGEVVYTSNKLNNKQEIDLILLSNGVYYLTLQDNSQKKVYKINKE